MARLLEKLLQQAEQEQEDYRVPDVWLLPASPPPTGVTVREWELRPELPLHLINLLRDQAAPLLALSQTGPGATPAKQTRPAKYEYNSPLRTVIESPAKVKPTSSDTVANPKKTRKKVNLFSSKRGGKANKSFSDVEEQLDGRVGCEVGVAGVTTLPTSPVKLSTSVAGRRTEETPQSGGRRPGKRQSPSPQTFSLGDFLTPIEPARRSGGRRVKGSRSPVKLAASTPLEESGAVRPTNLSARLGQLDLDSVDSFPEIGEASGPGGGSGGRRRVKPLLLSAGPQPSPQFGQKEVAQHAGAAFQVEEVEPDQQVDSRAMVAELVSGAVRITPATPSPAPAPVTPATPGRCDSAGRACTVPNPNLVTRRSQLDLLAGLHAQILHRNLEPNLTVELHFLVALLLLEVPAEEAGQDSPPGPLLLASLPNCVFGGGKITNLFFYS